MREYDALVDEFRSLENDLTVRERSITGTKQGIANIQKRTENLSANMAQLQEDLQKCVRIFLDLFS